MAQVLISLTRLKLQMSCLANKGGLALNVASCFLGHLTMVRVSKASKISFRGTNQWITTTIWKTPEIETFCGIFGTCNVKYELSKLQLVLSSVFELQFWSSYDA